jgi:hypothetical protein
MLSLLLLLLLGLSSLGRTIPHTHTPAPLACRTADGILHDAETTALLLLLLLLLLA